MEIIVKDTSISIVEGDITKIRADAIVNAANNQLWMGGGVAGAIKRAGGQVIEDEAVKLGPIPVGEAVATTAGTLSAMYVIHAAGMGRDLKTDEKKIEKATRNSLKRANELNLETIAFPSIGTGVGGFSMKTAASIMLHAAVSHSEGKTSVKRIIFVLYGKEAYKTFEDELKALGN
jgi:O-acetyl-ADP-ribose deacetylase (regulator of RNase III)